MRSSEKSASFQIQDGFSDSAPASVAAAAAAVPLVMSQERIIVNTRKLRYLNVPGWRTKNRGLSSNATDNGEEDVASQSLTGKTLINVKIENYVVSFGCKLCIGTM